MKIIEKKIVEIWENALKKKKISNSDNFFEIGGTSIKALLLINKVNQTFNKNLVISDLSNNFTISQMLKIVGKKDTGVDQYVKKLNAINKRKGNLFFVHDVSGYINGYLNLFALLSEDYELYGISADLKQFRYPRGIDIFELANAYVDEILTKDLSIPTSIIGWSDGGVIGFEIVNILEKKGVEINKLIMLDTAFPSAYDEFTIEKEKIIVKKIINSIDTNIDSFNDIQLLWDYLYKNISRFDKDLILSKLQLEFPYLFKYIPHLASSNLKKALNEINMCRTISFSASKYQVSKVIESEIKYFAPTEGLRNAIDDWSKFCANYKRIPIYGDHFTMLNVENIESLFPKFVTSLA